MSKEHVTQLYSSTSATSDQYLDSDPFDVLHVHTSHWVESESKNNLHILRYGNLNV